jgi:microcystin-dependent protein
VNFALPDLRGRVPLHLGSSFGQLGQRGGEYAHTLSDPEMPAHSHAVSARAAGGSTPNPAGSSLAGAGNAYHAPRSAVPLRPDTVANAGGSQPHTNQQPFLTISFCIALQGIFPSQN